MQLDPRIDHQRGKAAILSFNQAIISPTSIRKHCEMLLKIYNKIQACSFV